MNQGYPRSSPSEATSPPSTETPPISNGVTCLSDGPFMLQ